MPKEMETALRRVARRKFGSTQSERARKYIYGTMRQIGWKPEREKKGK